MNIFVSAWIGSKNLGDELIFWALKLKLTYRGIRITVPSINPQTTQKNHGVNTISHTNVVALANAINRSDALVFGGGGLLQDETSLLNLPYHLSRIWWSRLNRIPFVIIGVGAGPLSLLGRNIVSQSLRGHCGVSVRDKASVFLLSSIGVRSVALSADLSLSLPDPETPVLSRVVVCLRPLSSGKRILPVSMRPHSDSRSERFVDEMAIALDKVAITTGLKIHFVAFEVGKDNILHERVASRMKSPVTFACPTLKDVVREVGQGQVVIAMRYHAGIAAIVSGRPLVQIGYSPKVNSLSAELGPGSFLLPNDPGSFYRIPEGVESVLGNEKVVFETRNRLRARETENDKILDHLMDLIS